MLTRIDDGKRAAWSETLDTWTHRIYLFNVFLASIYVVFYVIINGIFLGGFTEEYTTSTARTGFFFHAVSGCGFYTTGYLQFSSYVRQNWPAFHRTCGWLYLILSAFLFFGILVVVIGGAMAPTSSATWTGTVIVFWVFVHYDAIVSIQRGDVHRHRRMMFRGFMMANSIIYMRFIVFSLSTYMPPPDALTIAFWLITTWAIGLSEVLLALEEMFRPDPVIYLRDGRKFYSHVGTGTAVLTDQMPLALEECEEILDNGTSALRLVFRILNRSDLTFFFPGQHVGLIEPVSGLMREYSPVVTEANATTGRVQLWIRLHPKGKMSQVLRSLVDNYKSGAVKASGATINPFVASSDSPKEAGIVLSEMAVLRESKAELGNAHSMHTDMLLTVSSSRLNYHANSFSLLILVAVGTGLAPYFNFINHVLNNPNDQTHIKLIYLCKSGTADSFVSSLFKSFNDPKNQMEIDIRKTTPRFDVRSLEEVVTSQFIGLDEVFSSSPNPAAKVTLKHRFQIHLSGAPAFVKNLDHGARRSKVLSLKPAQLVSWGFSDR